MTAAAPRGLQRSRRCRSIRSRSWPATWTVATVVVHGTPKGGSDPSAGPYAGGTRARTVYRPAGTPAMPQRPWRSVSDVPTSRPPWSDSHTTTPGTGSTTPLAPARGLVARPETRAGPTGGWVVLAVGAVV